MVPGTVTKLVCCVGTNGELHWTPIMMTYYHCPQKDVPAAATAQTLPVHTQLFEDVKVGSPSLFSIFLHVLCWPHLYSISHRNNLSNCCNQWTCLKVSTTHNICWEDHNSQMAQNRFSRISGMYLSLRLWWSHKVACWWNDLNLPSPDHCHSILAFNCGKLGVCKPRMGRGLYLPKCSYWARR